MQWFYVKDGKQQGPIDEQVLFELARQGSLKPDDLVWNSTMGAEWKPASSVPGLFCGTKEEEPVPAPQPESKPRSYGKISVGPPVEDAWAGMKRILFSPFSFAKWFALGFTAWLATLMEEGGSNFNFNRSDFGNAGNTVENATAKAAEFFREWGALLIVGVAVAVILVIAVSIVLSWVRSRGKFMFLDNVINDRAEIKAPWNTFAQHGNSLFAWQLVLSVVFFLLMLVILAIAGFGIIMPCVNAQRFVTTTIPLMVFVVLLLLAVSVVFGYINRFLEDFIIPIMYKHNLSATEAWQKFMPLFKTNFWKFVLYGLFYLVLGIAAGAMVLLAVLLTCCTLGCLLILPYIGAVAMLPVHIFFRLYGVKYLAQYGADYDLGV